MAYVSVESDDRRAPRTVSSFKSYLDPNGTTPTANSRSSPGYFDDGARKPPPGGGGFWTLDYYQPYFDVDTLTVLHRCTRSLLPTTPLAAYHPADLYGPFWVLSTLIFALFLSSSLAHALAAWLSHPDAPAAPDYAFTLLGVGVSVVYAYGLGLPALLWLALRYLGVGEWSVIEAVALYGYAQFVWIPVSLLCVIGVPLLRWILVGLAFGSSGAFLALNIYPILASAEAKSTRLIIIILTVLHAGLALSFKVLFFSYYPAGEVGPKDPLPGVIPGAGGGANTTAALFP